VRLSNCVIMRGVSVGHHTKVRWARGGQTLGVPRSTCRVACEVHHGAVLAVSTLLHEGERVQYHGHETVWA
jgi:hypothetical protein